MAERDDHYVMLVASIKTGLEGVQALVNETRIEQGSITAVLNKVQLQTQGMTQEMASLAKELDGLIVFTRGKYNTEGSLIARFADLDARLKQTFNDLDTRVKQLCAKLTAWQEEDMTSGAHRFSAKLAVMQGAFGILAGMIGAFIGYWLKK